MCAAVATSDVDVRCCCYVVIYYSLLLLRCRLTLNFIHSYIHSFIHLFIHSFCLSFINFAVCFWPIHQPSVKFDVKQTKVTVLLTCPKKSCSKTCSGRIKTDPPVANPLLYIYVAHMGLLSPVKRGYCFRFVCLSIRPSGTLFSHFVRVTPPTVFITHKQNLYHLEAGCLECVMGVSCSLPPKFRRNRSLKTAQNHIFHFLERHKSKSFRPRDAIPIPYTLLL